MLSRRELQDMARRNGVCFDDALMIALNTLGARSADSIPRGRMMIKLDSRPDDPLRAGLALASSDSPFEVEGNTLRFAGDPIATVEAVEHDDALLGYFRNQNRVLVLNSNARSGCTGCAFCPNSLEAASDPRLAALDDLNTGLRIFEAERGWDDLSRLEEVNVVTGCFHTEEPAIEHLLLVREALRQHNSQAMVGMLSSVIRSRAGLQRLAETVAPFMLVLTLECFDNRPALLKHSKVEFNPDDGPSILATAKSLGHEAGFTYIVGLEPLEPYLDPLRKWIINSTRFPNFQVYQPHNAYMRQFGAPGSDDVEYYLVARRQLESILADTGLRPLTWTNYRPLWYFEFAGEPLSGARV
jgi:hypothetical protein